MGGNFFSTKSATQTALNKQLAIQGGSGFTAAIGADSARAALGGGNITGDINAGAGAHDSIVTADPAVAMAALEANQAVSTQAIGFANVNAQTALQTLQSLGNTLAGVATVNTPANLAAAQASLAAPPASGTTKILVIAGIALVVLITAAVYFRR